MAVSGVICAISMKGKFCKDCWHFNVFECSWWCSKNGEHNYDIDPYDEACEDSV